MATNVNYWKLLQKHLTNLNERSSSMRTTKKMKSRTTRSSTFYKTNSDTVPAYPGDCVGSSNCWVVLVQC